MAKKYGATGPAPTGPTCVWPLCDRAKGLVTFFRCFDMEPLEHCGEHHATVSMLHRRLHPEED